MRGVDIVGDVGGRPEAVAEALREARRTGDRRDRRRGVALTGGYFVGGPADLEMVRALREAVADGAVAIMGAVELDLALGAAAAVDGARALRGRARTRHDAVVAALGGFGSEGHVAAAALCAAMPLWLRAGALTVAHACPAAAAGAAVACGPDGRLTEAGLMAAVRPSAERGALRAVADGPRTRLPDGLTWWDEGVKRGDVLSAWWEPGPATWRAAVVGCPLDTPYDGPRPPARSGLRAFARYGALLPRRTGPGWVHVGGPGTARYAWDGEAEANPAKLTMR